ncbi:MAG TPA: PKD domain-containing protein [bacterium]
MRPAGIVSTVGAGIVCLLPGILCALLPAGPALAAAGDPPTAVATADPVTMYCPQEVRFDGTGSFHGDPGRRIAAYAWDFHYDGSFTEEASGPTAAATYGELGSFTAALRVTDDGDPAASGLATVAVEVVNRAPVAAAGDPYTVAIGKPLSLSAAGSSDPDAPCGDAIAEYAWDLDDDGKYGDVSGALVKLGWEQVRTRICGGACTAGTQHTVGLRVKDRSGLSTTAAATVAIAAGTAKVTLTWPNGGEFLGTGRAQTIRWVAGTGVASVRVSLRPDGGSWRVVVPGTPASRGMASWTPSPSTYKVTARNWRIKVEGLRNDGAVVAMDVSDAPFAIGPLDLTAAEKGVEVVGGSTLHVTWTRALTAAPVAYTRFSYSLDDGASWQAKRIGGNPGSYDWRVPAAHDRTDGCRARVELYGGADQLLGRDSGQGTFSILGGVDLTSPEGGDTVYGGTTRTVRWVTRAGITASSVRLRLSLDSGATWTDLATVPGNPGTWIWGVPALAVAAPSCRLEVALLDAVGGTLAADPGEGLFSILVKGDAYATAPPAAPTVPAASSGPDYQVTWGASSTPEATYELQEATNPGFTAGLRAVYAGGLLAAQIAGRANGSTYYYRVRALRAGWNPSPWVAGGNGCQASWDATAPGPVTGFAAAGVSGRVNLSWVNPGDADFAGVRVLRRTDRAPAGPDDGALVYQGQGTAAADVGLGPGTYHYAAFAHDAALNFSPGATATADVAAASACEGCHNGDGDGDGVWTGVGYDPDGAGPLPAAPNVMGDGVSPGGVGTNPKPYDDGTYGYNVNGHGTNGTAPHAPADSIGFAIISPDATCTACHDISLPAGTHLDGVLNSVETKQHINGNTAHLNASWIGISAPDWSVQLTLDNRCAYQCHTPANRHRHNKDALPAPGVTRFGAHGSVMDGQGIPYPIDVHLSTNAPGSPADGVTSFD